MALTVREAETDEDLRLAAWVDATGFSQVLDDAWFERGLPLRRSSTWYLAERDGEVAGTCALLDFRLSVPGGANVAMGGVGDLVVLPGHRRRGVLPAMMDRLLDDAETDGRVAVGLYASGAGIYGRHGFGPSTRTKRYRIRTARGALRTDAPVAAGRVVHLHPSLWRTVLPDAHRMACARRPGEVAVPPQAWDVVLGAPPGMGADNRLCLVHEAPGGAVDGYVLYSVESRWSPTGAHHVASISRFAAADTPVELAMWEAILSLDLIEDVGGHLPADSVLFDALQDRWAIETTGEIDGLWLRILDVPAALGARSLAVAGSAVLDVVDERRPHVGGCFRISGGPGEATVVERIGGADGARDASGADGGAGPVGVDLQLGIAELGSLWLGGTSLARLVAAGRVDAVRPEAVPLVDAMLRWWPTPGLVHDF